MIREMAAKARELGLESLEVDVRDPLFVRVRGVRRSRLGDRQSIDYTIARVQLESEVGGAVESHAEMLLARALSDA